MVELTTMQYVVGVILLLLAGYILGVVESYGK